MEIIPRGTPPEEKKYTVTCTNCKTVFSFLGKEAITRSDRRDGDYLTIACPVCERSCTTSVNPGSSYWDR